MPLIVVLGVGLERSLLTPENVDWKSAGFVLTPTWSIQGAIDLFRNGDFDLVILGHSIQAESRERLAYLIRASGSGIPVVCIADSSTGRDAFADATITSDPSELLEVAGRLLALRARMPAMNQAHTAIRVREPR